MFKYEFTKEDFENFKAYIKKALENLTSEDLKSLKEGSAFNAMMKKKKDKNND